MNRQLVLVRQFFDEARRAPAAETPFMRMRRTLNLDLCVELALNVVIHDRGSDAQQKKLGRGDFIRAEQWKVADEIAVSEVGRSLPEFRRLKTLHELRNLAQHRGTIPSAEDIRELVEPTRALLDFVCRQLFDRDFENLREWDALEYEPLRHWLLDCAEAIDRGAPYAAVVVCKVAYGRIVQAVRGTIADPLPAPGFRRTVHVTNRELANVVNAIGGGLKDFSKALQEVLLAMESEIMAVGIGLSIADHIRFLRCGRHVQVMDTGPSGYRSWATGGDPEQHREDAVFMLDYLAKATVMLESALPGVFGGLQLGPRPSQSDLWELVEKPDPNG